MCKLIILLSCILITTAGFSQNKDLVYLKNGSIIKGKIIEVKADDYVKVRTKDGSIWVYKFSDIEKFDMEDNNTHLSLEKDTLKKRFLLIDLGFLVGTVDNTMKAPLSIFATYTLIRQNSFYAGLGAGLEFYQMTYLPLVVDFRIKPYIIGTSFFVQFGYSLPIKKSGKLDGINYNFEPGFLFNPGLTYTFQANQGTAFTITVGYRYQRTSAKQLDRYYNDDYRRIEKLNRFVLRLGYTFR